MIAIRVVRDVFRPDNKKAAESGLVGLVDDAEWSNGSLGELRVLLEGRKNRTTLPRDAVTPIKFGLWEPNDHVFLAEGGSVVSFDDPHAAKQMSEGTGFVVAEIPVGPWAPPSVYDSEVPRVTAALLALVDPK